MNPEQIAELETAATAAATAAEDAGGTDDALNKAKEDADAALQAAKAPSQDSLAKELERVKRPKTEAEKAAFALRSNAQRAKELGLDPRKIIGVEPEIASDANGDEVPEWYKKLQTQNAEKDALTLANEIPDSRERELVLHQLQTVITSGSAEERVRVARGYVNSVRNAQIAEETARGGATRRHGSAPGAGARQETGPITDLTDDERAMLNFRGSNGKPLLTEDDIRKARAAQPQA